MSNKWQKNNQSWRSGLLVLGMLITGHLSLSTAVQADAPKFSGFIDTTYNYDFNNPASRTTLMRTFDRKTDAFLLNAAQLNIEGSKEGIGYYAELAFGTDPSQYKAAGTNSPNEPNLPNAPSNVATIFDVQEAFLTYKEPHTNIQLKAGKFVTLEGIEVIESKDDFTVTRGLMFGMAEPFTHVGAIVGYALPKYAEVWVGLINGWDLVTDNNRGKTFLAKVGLNFGDKVQGNLSFYRGAEKANNTNDARTSFDSTWFVKPLSNLTIALQQNIGEEEHSSLRDGGAAHWYGIGIQPKLDFNKMVSLGARYEWFSDLDGARHPNLISHVMQTIALAPTFNLTDSVMFRAEVRYDWSSKLTFETSDGNFSKGEVSTVSTEFIYKF